MKHARTTRRAVAIVAQALLMLSMLVLDGACGSNNAEDFQACGLNANGATCGTNQYCVCFAESVSVDERTHPGCAQPDDAGTDDIALSGGAPGVCEPCSWNAYCGTGHLWDAASCMCH